MPDTLEVRLKVPVKKLVPDAKLPVYSTEGAACADVFCLKGAHIPPGETKCFGLGLAFQMPEGWMLEFRPRSGLSCRLHAIIPNAPGTLDEDYRGEACVYLHNYDDEFTVTIEDGDRIAQVRPVEVTRATFCEVDELTETKRGAGGFGSTGR